jgi:RNA recognition motif-containing protein
LSYDTTERTIGECFAAMGRVIEVIVVVDKQSRRPKGYAFVTFEHEQSAVRAMREMQGVELEGRALRVELSGGAPAGRMNNTGRNDKPPQQDNVQDLNNASTNGGEPIRGSHGRIREDLEDVTDHSTKSCQIYVGSLNYDMRDPDLRQVFQDCGDIKEATVLMDRANPHRSRGYGFITFATPEAAQTAIDKYNDEMIKGRRITVRRNTARRLERKSDNNRNNGGRERSRSRERR